MERTNEILLLGAYGFTALKIVSQLDNAGIRFSIAGRDRLKLESIRKDFACVNEVHQIDIQSEPEVEAMLSKTGFLINCIGPYNHYGDLILRKAVEAGICYMDICGEQHFIRNSMLNYSEEAKKTGACIIHSLAFESALTDLLASSMLSREKKWKEISAVYYFEKSIPSAGTRMSMQTSKFFPTYYVEDQKLIQSGVLGFSKMVEHFSRPEMDAAVFMPYPEVLFFHDRYSPEKASTYLLIRQMDAKYLMAGTGAELTLETVLAREKKRNRPGPDEEACRKQYFEIVLYAVDSQDKEYCFQLQGNDMYTVTASIVVSFLKLLINAESLPAGIHSPSDAGIQSSSILNVLLNDNNILLIDDYSFRIKERI